MEERFVMTTNWHLTDAEMEQIRAQFRQWSQRCGGLLVLPAGASLTPFPSRPTPIHEGVSDEQLSWADEVAL